MATLVPAAGRTYLTSGGFAVPAGETNRMTCWSDYSPPALPSIQFVNAFYGTGARYEGGTGLPISTMYLPGVPLKEKPTTVTVRAKAYESACEPLFVPGSAMFNFVPPRPRGGRDTAVVLPAAVLNFVLRNHYMRKHRLPAGPIEPITEPPSELDSECAYDANDRPGDWTESAERISKYLLYIGILVSKQPSGGCMREPGSGGVWNFELARKGRHEVPNYWPRAGKSSHVGFVLKRIPDGDLRPGPFVLDAWCGGTECAPAHSEIIYSDAAGVPQRGIFFPAGQVMETTASRADVNRTSLVVANMLGKGLRSQDCDLDLTPIANAVSAAPKIEVALGAPRWHPYP